MIMKQIVQPALLL